MQVWIDQPVEPTTLILAWQAPDAERDRLRWAVGAIDIGTTPIFRYFSEDELPSHNVNRTAQELRTAGFTGYPAFPYRPGAAFKTEILKTFLRRLPPPSRGDFEQYCAYFSIKPGARISEWLLLGLTEARLPSDGFSLVDPLAPAAETGDAVVEIAGYRYETGAAEDLKPGDALSLKPDPTNEYDPNAVAVLRAGKRIGFVNRLQAPTIRIWLEERQLECEVLRKNGRADAPRAYAKVSIRPKARELAA